MHQHFNLRQICRRSHRQALLLLVLPAGFFATACSTHVNPQDRAMLQDKVAGDDVKILWTRPEPTARAKRMGHSDQGLFVQRIAVSNSDLLLDMEHLSLDSDRADEVQSVSISMYVDGCPGPRFRDRGQLPRSAKKPTRISIAQAELPHGDLEISFTAFEASTNVLLRHNESGVFPITEEERKGFHRIPEDKASGFPATAYIDEPECTR